MISYKPLFYTLVSKNMKISDLNAVLPNSVTSKFRKNRHITTATLDKVCTFLSVPVEQVIEHLPDDGPR